MDTERHVEIDETHETPEPEPEAEQAVAQTVAAEAAVALAGATAAAAELDAAERMRRFEAENEEWRNRLGQSVISLSENLRTLREDELSSLNAERQALSESLGGLTARMDQMESRLSNPPPSMPPAEEASPLIGGEAAIAAGPIAVEAGSSIGSNEEAQTPSERAHPVRRRRWI